MNITPAQDALLRACCKDEAAYERMRQLVSIQAQRIELLERTLDALPEQITLYDTDRRNIHSNRTLMDLYGIKPEDLLGKRLEELGFVAQENIDLFNETFQWVTETGNTSSREFQHPSPKGIRTFHGYLGTIRNADGALLGVLHKIADISEQVTIRQQLVDTERLLARINQTLPDLIYIYDLAEGRNIYVHHNVQKILGYTQTDVNDIGDQVLQRLIHPEDFERYLTSQVPRHQTLRDGEVLKWEYRVQHKAGGWRWLHSREVVFQRDDTGRPSQILGIAQDITEHKQAEMQRARLQARYNELVANIPAMVYTTSINEETGQWQLRYVSQRSRDLFDIEPEDLLQKPHYIAQIVHPNDRESLIASEHRALSQKRFLWEGRVIVRGEERWIHMESYPRTDVDGRLIYDGIALDITASKLLDASRLERERLRLELEKSRQLNEIKTNMMERLSHEFRTPLAIIQTSFELIVRYQKRLSEERREEHVDKVYQQINHLTDMLDEILMVLRSTGDGLTTAPNNPVSVKLAVKTEVNRLNAVYKGRQLSLRTPETPTLAEIDARHLQIALKHLLTNALKFSDPADTVQIDVTEQMGIVMISIEDAGIGIPLDEQSGLFQPFFRASNVGAIGGVGMGLHIVNSIVEHYTGRLIIESDLNTGTRVTLQFPRYEPQP